uniref:Uncharacterized protein n=1 Tax=Ananas comosus var. bracteatus TaxID=296719 RepID=A0A6V7Q612_ANACO|nr:unnamed protein product [Ananas comosus var. bracteatus]
MVVKTTGEDDARRLPDHGREAAAARRRRRRGAATTRGAAAEAGGDRWWGGGVAIPLPAERKRRRLLSTESGFFALAKAFAAGVILATGFVHMLHDAEAALTDPCLSASPGAASPSPLRHHGRHPRPRLPRHPVLRAQAPRCAAAETDATAEDDEERSIITAASEPPVDEDEDEGSAKGGDAVHIVRMRAHAAAHGHSHHPTATRTGTGTRPGILAYAPRRRLPSARSKV